jgi:hypothetical protein
MMSVIDFSAHRYLKNGTADLRGIYAEAVSQIEQLRSVNLLELPARARSKLIKDMARFKMIAAVSSPQVDAALEIFCSTHNRATTEQELIEIAQRCHPNLFSVSLL